MEMSWSNIWDRMASAEWIADTGVPLVASVVALVVAVVIFRRQLSSDRRHLEQTLQHDREQQAAALTAERDARLAEHRREAAQRLAARLKDALQWSLDDPPPLRREFDERFQLRLALTTGQLQLGDVPKADAHFEMLTELLDAGQKAWEICETVRARGDGPKGVVKWMEEVWHVRFAGAVTTAYVTGLYVEAENLYGWPGVGPLPSHGDPRDELRVYQTDKQAWADEVETWYLTLCERQRVNDGPGASNFKT